MKLECERYHERVNLGQKSLKQLDCENASLAKAEQDLAKATEVPLFSTGDLFLTAASTMPTLAPPAKEKLDEEPLCGSIILHDWQIPLGIHFNR